MFGTVNQGQKPAQAGRLLLLFCEIVVICLSTYLLDICHYILRLLLLWGLNGINLFIVDSSY